MKTLQKYANMGFLLLSVATIVPAYANSTDEYTFLAKLEKKYVTLKEQTIQLSTRPEMLKAVFQGLEIAGMIGVVAFASAAFSAHAKAKTK